MTIKRSNQKNEGRSSTMLGSAAQRRIHSYKPSTRFSKSATSLGLEARNTYIFWASSRTSNDISGASTIIRTPKNSNAIPSGSCVLRIHSLNLTEGAACQSWLLSFMASLSPITAPTRYSSKRRLSVAASIAACLPRSALRVSRNTRYRPRKPTSAPTVPLSADKPQSAHVVVSGGGGLITVSTISAFRSRALPFTTTEGESA